MRWLGAGMVQIVQEMAEEAVAASKQGPGGAEGAEGGTERERQAAVAAAAGEALKFGCFRDAASFLRVYGWDSGEGRTCSLARCRLAGGRWGACCSRRCCLWRLSLQRCKQF